MEPLMWLLLTLGGLVVAIATNLISAEICDRGPLIARWLIKWATKQLPIEIRERYREEWLAHIQESGKLESILHGVGCIFASFKIAKSWQPANHPEARKPSYLRAIFYQVTGKVDKFELEMDALEKIRRVEADKLKHEIQRLERRLKKANDILNKEKSKDT